MDGVYMDKNDVLNSCPKMKKWIKIETQILAVYMYHQLLSHPDNSPLEHLYPAQKK